MKTSIGEGWRQSNDKSRLLAAALIGATSLRIDFCISANWWIAHNSALRATNTIVALILYASLTPSPRRDLGLCFTIDPNLRYWVRIAAILVAILLSVGAIGNGVLHSGHLWRDPENIPTTPPHAITEWILSGCVKTPLLEELLYRVILCAPIAAVSPASAIAASGVIFASLHFVYGNPGPDNFAAGYLLAWCYLKSGTIFIPILLHAGGNAIILGIQVAAWYVLYG